MKILHLCLAAHYTEEMTYQDNLLPLQNALDGHEVVIVSDCYMYKDGQLVCCGEEDRVLSNGVRLVRMKYDYIINNFISGKIRKVSRLYDFICSIKPDVILFHGVAGWEMLSAAKYKKNNPNIKLYIDSHEDFNNSGLSWVSRLLQYKIFNRFVVRKIKRLVDKFLYITYESKIFIQKMYFLENDEVEFYPLGGEIVDKVKKESFRNEIECRYNLSEEDMIIVHSGKLDVGKRTEVLLNALYRVENKNLKLFVIGMIPEDCKATILPLIERDNRVIYVGWKRSKDLIKYLSAADLYIQPGTQSATMQNAICCGTPVALYPYPSYKAYVKGNGFFVESVDDCVTVLKDIGNDPQSLLSMSDKSYELAYKILDYKVLASRLYR